MCIKIKTIKTEGGWTHPEQKLELTINKQKKIGLKCDIKKYLFQQTKIYYFGF